MGDPFTREGETMGTDDRGKRLKEMVALEAAKMVGDGAIVGLGTGSTAALAIAELGRRVREEGLEIIGIPTSYQAAMIAREHGIIARALDDVSKIDIAIDGADEVDPNKNLIKGRGAAHTREKIVDSWAELFVVVIDESKLVEHLGEKFSVPVEVLPFALQPVMKSLQALGGNAVLRMGVKKDGPVITDQGNMIIDVRFAEIKDPKVLETHLNNIPGVVENGLFVDLAHVILVGATEEGGKPIVRRID
jgi:ribose 5-phosphate isomerase A